MVKKFEITKTKKVDSLSNERIIIVGTHGIGKSTLAASAPNSLFIRTESGLDEINAESFPLCKKYSDFIDQLKYFYTEDLPFDTLSIDTIDWLEKLIYDSVCSENNVDSISDIDYGGGYTKALVKFNEVISALTGIRRKKNTRIILLAHAEIKQVMNPLGPDYHKWQIKLRDKNAHLLMEWADIVGFMHTPTYVSSEDKGFGKKVNKASGGAGRVLSCCDCPSYEAKNRYLIEEDIPINIKDGYSSVIKAIDDGRKKLDEIQLNGGNKND